MSSIYVASCRTVSELLQRSFDFASSFLRFTKTAAHSAFCTDTTSKSADTLGSGGGSSALWIVAIRIDLGLAAAVGATITGNSVATRLGKGCRRYPE